MSAVTVLAVSYPVLDVLGSNPEFFVARSSPQSDAFATVALLGIGLPLIAAAVVWLAALAHEKLGRLLHGAVVTSGFGLLAVQIAGSTVPSSLALLIGVGLAVPTFLVYLRLDAARELVRWGVGIPFVAAASFIFLSPTSQLLEGAETATAGSPVDVQDPVPVVLILFDELPTGLLLDGPDSFNENLYPNIASFAEDAVWYRRATSTSNRTTLAVPAVLTGRYVEGDALPIASDHPLSIFTVLASSHDIRASEPITNICPESMCGSGDPASKPAGLVTLASDVSLVAAHVVLPSSLTVGLPSVSQTWGNFGEERRTGPPEGGTEAGEEEFHPQDRVASASQGDRRRDFEGLTQGVGNERPPAIIAHTMLPHIPYKYLPSGQELLPYPQVGLTEDGQWQDDPWLVRFNERLHMLQTGLADKMLEGVLSELNELRLYREAIIVVAADHGVSFDPGGDRRGLSRASLHELAQVPLLVKYPDNRGAARIDDRPAQTIDILPTILDVVGADVSGLALDGRSLLDGTSQSREMMMDDGTRQFEVSANEIDPWQFGSAIKTHIGTTWSEVYTSGPFSKAIGRSRSELRSDEAVGAWASIKRPHHLTAVDAASDAVPAVVSGTVGLAGTRSLPSHIAIIFDDEIVGVGRTYGELNQDDEVSFVALVPPEAYGQRGVSDIGLGFLAEEDGAIVLTPIELSE